jgi:hypothetical protein
MPGAVKGVIAIVIIQAVFNGLGALVLFAYGADRNDHGQDGAGFANRAAMAWPRPTRIASAVLCQTKGLGSWFQCSTQAGVL